MDLPPASKKVLLTEYKKYKKKPSKDQLKKLVQKLTPHFKEELFRQVKVKVKKELPKMKGNGLSLAGGNLAIDKKAVSLAMKTLT